MKLIGSPKELAELDIVYAAEDDDYYYVRPSPEEYYDQTAYRIGKHTHRVEFIYYTDIMVNLRAKEREPKAIISELKSMT